MATVEGVRRYYKGLLRESDRRTAEVARDAARFQSEARVLGVTVVELQRRLEPPSDVVAMSRAVAAVKADYDRLATDVVLPSSGSNSYACRCGWVGELGPDDRHVCARTDIEVVPVPDHLKLTVPPDWQQRAIQRQTAATADARKERDEAERLLLAMFKRTPCAHAYDCECYDVEQHLKARGLLRGAE